MHRLTLILLCAAGAGAAQVPATLDIHISTETVPAGSMAQIKVYLGTPQPISGGNIILRLSGAGLASPTPIQAATVFSATGDVSAAGNIDPNGGFTVLFSSPSAGAGRLPGVPLLEFSIPVTSAFSVVLDPASSFTGPAGNYTMTAQPGGATIGGTLSIQNVTPAGSTGVLPADATVAIQGTGFQSGAEVEIDGASVASVNVASASLIDVRLGGATEITGKRIVVSNPDGSQITYWGGLGDSLFTFPLNTTSSAICGRMGPAFENPVSLVVQNPNRVAAQVTISGTFGAGPGATVTVTIPSSGIYRTSLEDPPYSMVQTGASTPIRILAFVSSSYVADPLVFLPVVPQTSAIPLIGSVVNASSQVQSAISPGEIVTILGVGIGPSSPAGATLDGSGVVARILSGVQALFNGVPAPILYASASQLNVVVPYEIYPYSAITLQVNYNGTPSIVWSVPTAAAAPGIFTVAESGEGGGSVLNQDNSVNSASNPAAAGSVVQIFATGEGLTFPAATTGVIANAGNPASPIFPVKVTIGGGNAVIVYAGSAPGSVAGLFQVNVQLPGDVARGLAVPVVLMVGAETSQAGVTVAVQ